MNNYIQKKYKTRNTASDHFFLQSLYFSLILSVFQIFSGNPVILFFTLIIVPFVFLPEDIGSTYFMNSNPHRVWRQVHYIPDEVIDNFLQFRIIMGSGHHFIIEPIDYPLEEIMEIIIFDRSLHKGLSVFPVFESGFHITVQQTDVYSEPV